MLGFPHWDYLEPFLSGKQYHDWILYLQHYQPYPNRDDVTWGRLMYLIYALWQDKKEMTFHDFIPYFNLEDRFEQDLTVEDMKRRLSILD